MTPLLSATVFVCLFAATTFAGEKALSPKAPDPIEQLTGGRGQYEFPSGTLLRFTNPKDGALIISSGGRELYRLARGSSVGQTLQSPDHRTLLLLVSISTPLDAPKGSDVTIEAVSSTGILRIYSDRKDRVTCAMHMTDAQLPKELRAMTISHLESVLNDGLTVQMQVIRISDEPGSSASVVAAEVWDLAAQQRGRVDEDYYD